MRPIPSAAQHELKGRATGRRVKVSDNNCAQLPKRQGAIFPVLCHPFFPHIKGIGRRVLFEKL